MVIVVNQLNLWHGTGTQKTVKLESKNLWAEFISLKLSPLRQYREIANWVIAHIQLMLMISVFVRLWICCFTFICHACNTKVMPLTIMLFWQPAALCVYFFWISEIAMWLKLVAAISQDDREILHVWIEFVYLSLHCFLFLFVAVTMHCT